MMMIRSHEIRRAALLPSLLALLALAPAVHATGDILLPSERPMTYAELENQLREIERWTIEVPEAGRWEIDAQVVINEHAGEVRLRLDCRGASAETVINQATTETGPVWVPIGGLELPAGTHDLILSGSSDFAGRFEQGYCMIPTLRLRDGYRSIFNGRDFEGWTYVGDHAPGYVIEEGMIVCPEGGGGNLFTEATYDDFALRFEFRLTPNANNGLAIRAPLEGDPAYAGMEIQVLDDSGDRYADLRSTQYHGSIYDVRGAVRGHLRPVGSWNVQEVICEGRRVRVILNGVPIVDVDLDGLRRASVLEKHPGLARASGHLGFLGHGSRVEFRDLRLKPLPPDLAWSFDDAPSDGLPAGWSAVETNGGGTPARWGATGDGAIAVIESGNAGETFNLALAPVDEPVGDLELNVRVRADGGSEDQGGGPAWRIGSGDDYYLCRLNPLEGNFRAYAVRGGKREMLDSADVDLEAGRWYDVRVRMIGSRMRCALDGVVLLDARDATHAAGSVGLWTKADATTAFDELTLRVVAE